MEMPRLFTLAEANALLPQVRPLVEKVVECKKEVDKLRKEFEALDASKAHGNGYDMRREQITRRITDLMRQTREALEELYRTGCNLKDLDVGLLDFPAMRDGVVVNLCWKLGEEAIGFWHPLDSNFNGRRPIEEF